MFIKELRERLNLTQSEFAKNLNINQAIVSRYENKKLRPTSEFIIRLIKTFNANPNFYFFWKRALFE
ncbi:helix-turn-helix transcriptional regulator [Campylobacter jejuni]|nr:helix-turn-helix transcriptional regulator [Campylobacter jejuni]